ncbi:MAG: MarR family transcriptional regulator [Acidimicrobiales bacterium]
MATRRRLGPVAWAVLEVLVTAADLIEGGGVLAEINVRALASELGLSKDTVASALKRLIDGGFVRRESARFIRSQYLIDGRCGLRPCPGLSCPYPPDTNICDRPTSCDSSTPRHTRPRYEIPECVERLRLFE